MTVFLLHEELFFPDPEFANPDGLLAIGGDLSAERLILAYKTGIFPWYNNPPILWWSPPVRAVIFPRLFNMSRSLYQSLKKDCYKVTFDKDFLSVIQKCATVKRKDSEGTWIRPEIIEAYMRLFQVGLAHSVETWQEEKLVGGLYGVTIGKAFFGESMFSEQKDASKVALACLVKYLIDFDFYFIDCQVPNEHLLSLGAYCLPRPVFLKILNEAINVNSSIIWDREIETTSEIARILKEKLIKRRKKKNETYTF